MKTKAYTVQQVKRGRRLYGGVYQFDLGYTAYVAYRKHKEIYRNGARSISDAIRQGIAAWAIDEQTLNDMRARGIKIIGVLVRDTNDLYLTRIGEFFDVDKATIMNWTSRGGSLQRALPFSYWRIKKGGIKL